MATFRLVKTTDCCHVYHRFQRLDQDAAILPRLFEAWNCDDMAMDQYLLIPFLMGWTSMNPSYFDVNYRGTIGFDTLPYSDKWY